MESKKPEFCLHANEVPAQCYCEQDCYCKDNTCKKSQIFFTSDWHLNETRILPNLNPFFRPFKSVVEQNETIINNCNEIVGENDTLYHLGDVAMDLNGVEMLGKIKCKNKFLILGNYDMDKIPALSEHFTSVLKELNLYLPICNQTFFLNHYPKLAKPWMMNIVGHIHGLWKVQPNTINVGVDAWNYRPINAETIVTVKTAMEKYYDEDVFPLVNNIEKMREIMLLPDYKNPET